MEPKPVWNLRLRGESPHDLEQSEFFYKADAPPHVRSGSEIPKRPAVRALLYCLIELKIRGLRKDDNSLLQGPSDSPVAILARALWQVGKPEGKRIDWPVKLCGERNPPIILDLFRCRHLRKGSPSELFVIESGKFPILGENVHVFFGRREVTELDELQVLAQELCSHCTRHPNSQSGASTTAEEADQEMPAWASKGVLVYASELCPCGSESSHPEQSVTSSQQLRNGGGSPCPGPRGNQGLADWFRSMTLPQIKSFITAAQLAPGESSAKVLDEVREPECINVLATKMVQADYHDYFDFCADLFSDVPAEVKRAAAAVIVANRQLKDQLLVSLLGGEFPVRVFNWIFQISKCYSTRFYRELDSALSSVLQQPKNRWFLDRIGIEGTLGLTEGYNQIYLIQSLAVLMGNVCSKEWHSLIPTERWFQGRNTYFEHSRVLASASHEIRYRLDPRGKWSGASNAGPA